MGLSGPLIYRSILTSSPAYLDSVDMGSMVLHLRWTAWAGHLALMGSRAVPARCKAQSFKGPKVIKVTECHRMSQNVTKSELHGSGSIQDSKVSRVLVLAVCVTLQAEQVHMFTYICRSNIDTIQPRLVTRYTMLGRTGQRQMVQLWPLEPKGRLDDVWRLSGTWYSFAYL